MAKTPRASKVSDATASDATKPAKKTAAKQAAPAEVAAATAKGSKKKAAAEAAAPKKAAKQRAAAAERAPAPKKAAKKRAAAAEAPAPKKGAKKSTADAPASKKAAKKGAKKSTADAPASKKAAASAERAPAPKKTAKKNTAGAEAPATKKVGKKGAASAEQAPAKTKASKKQAADAQASQQLAFSMDIETPATTTSAPTPRGPLQPGDRVPDFSLEADDGQTYSRQSLAGERFVIYFYPKDDTPGCTREACDFRDERPRFEAANVKVLGVSGDSLKSHGRFRSKYQLDFPLLSDPDRNVAQAFGAVGEKKLYGKTSIGIIRSTFVVGPDGVVEKTFSPVKVDGHAAAVLQALGSG